MGIAAIGSESVTDVYVWRASCCASFKCEISGVGSAIGDGITGSCRTFSRCVDVSVGVKDEVIEVGWIVVV